MKDISKFFELHKDLLTGKIDIRQYWIRTTTKLREFLFNRSFYRRWRRKHFAIEKVFFKKITRENQNTNRNSYLYEATYKNRSVAKISLSFMPKWEQDFNVKGPCISGAHVEPFYRGLGLGHALYQYLLKDAKDMGIKYIYQTINRTNKRNNSLSKKLGFKRVTPVELENKLIGQCRMYAWVIKLD
ncbi:MAG: GNAT family N-acetyltransferase [Candidatus Omnitrophica bacterium]|nr:GNAT family N-acetyltransferase [Candidatus Omnitrophota bacterium]